MSYQPYLISNYATGLDRHLQPWLGVDDAFYELFDGYVYRGVTNKRDGYSGLANGGQSTYVESRMVHTITAEAYGTGDGTVGPYIHTAANLPIARGSVTITAAGQTATDTGTPLDNGNGVFVTVPAGGTGTIDYTTGEMTITFNGVVAGAVPITVTYDYHQGLPVMGIMRFYPNDNVVKLLVADTTYVNIFNASTERLEDITTTPYTGTYQDFWSWVNYQDPQSVPRLLFANGVSTDVIQQYDGTTVSAYAPTFTTGGVATTINARQIFEFQDRLIMFQTYEKVGINPVNYYPRRIRISGYGSNCDNFDLTAPGAGFIDIPDNTVFYGAAFNRDDLMFFTESSTWLLKYTGNDVTPFVLKKVDGSRGSKAAFSVLSYLNRTMAASPRGLIIVDGYTVSRMDEAIPDFAFNSINNEFFQSCFSGFIDEDRDVYTMYPSKGDVRPALVDAGSSDRILVSNFEEDTYAIYRIPMSCMGNFEVANTLTWSDLTPEAGFATWDDLAAKYSSWNAFPYSKGVPVAIGGGHKGEVWKITENESQDNPLRIRNITVTGTDTVQVTTDWNNYEQGDYIFFSGVAGMTQINNRQGVIDNVDVDYNTFTLKLDFETTDFDAYVSGGIASRTIPFEALTKKFNPFVNTDAKLKCGWIYFYVTCTRTLTEHTEMVDGVATEVPDTPFLLIDVFMNDYKRTTTPSYKYMIDLSSSSTDIEDLSEEKRWVKIWINQVGKFLQFRMHNTQAGTQIKIDAMMPGFAKTGRLI